MAKIAQGGYGHDPSGKMYAYRVPDNARVGQRYNVPAYNVKAKRVINTMFTVMSTKKDSTQYAKNLQDYLARKPDLSHKGEIGIRLRTVNGTNILDLPTGRKFARVGQNMGLDESRSKALWSLSSKISTAEREGHDQTWVNASLARERLLGLSTKKDNTLAVDEILKGRVWASD